MTANPILSASPLEPIISLRDLRVSYGEREILHGINFDVLRGETLVILGGSGSGKSTLLRTLVGLEKPSAGQIWIKGRDLAKASAAEMDEIRTKIGMSFQGGALFGSMTVGENVALPLREHTKLEDSTIEIMLRLKLEQVGLVGFEYYMPSQLSGGMKKRAAVARALAMDPEILFFDEPKFLVSPSGPWPRQNGGAISGRFGWRAAPAPRTAVAGYPSLGFSEIDKMSICQPNSSSNRPKTLLNNHCSASFASFPFSKTSKMA